MKRCVFNHLLLLSVAAALVLFVSCKEKNEQANNKYNETTQMLVSLVDNNSNLKSLLEEAIDKAKDINPDPETNPAGWWRHAAATACIPAPATCRGCPPVHWNSPAAARWGCSPPPQ